MTEEHPTWSMTIGDNGAELIMMPCPGTKQVDLASTITQLKKQGVNAILSVMPAEEMTRLEVETLPDNCRQHDIHWFNLAAGNHQVPDDQAISDWQQYKAQITQLIDQGGKVAVHCKGGTGRTGLGAAMVLLELGWTPEQAISDIKSIKPKAFSHESYVEFIENMKTDASVVS